MAFINYDLIENSLSAVKLSSKFKDDLEYLDKDGVFQVIQKSNKFAGLKIANFLSELELKGRLAEQAFKDLLESNKVPCLYIGQGPIGIEVSETLKSTVKSKRPDFLINIPNVGIWFVDVKYRRKIGFSGSNQKYFQMFCSEVRSLVNLYELVMIPVWLAFYDENSVNGKTFYLIPVSLLKRYLDLIYAKITAREQKLLSVIRIPDELLDKVEDELVFKVGYKEISENLISQFSSSHKGLVRRIEDEIKSVIRNESVLKSKIADRIVNKIGSDIFFKPEVDIVLGWLIEEGTVVYNAKKPLGLLGE